MKFELQHTDTLTSARTGVLTTEHGPIETPVFMPVGYGGFGQGCPSVGIEGRYQGTNHFGEYLSFVLASRN